MPDPTVDPRASAAERVVREHLAAFNDHDTARLLDSFTDDAVWITGADRFAGTAALGALFDDGLWELDPHLELVRLVVDADSAAAQLVERITVDGTLSTFAIAVFFEIRDGRISRGKVYREGSADLS